jgi:glutaredoxin
MANIIFTAQGCARCDITKRFMQQSGIAFEAYDIKSDGKDLFSEFYRAHRADIYRDRDGVEFPVFTDGRVIRQGVGIVLGHLIAGDALCGFILRGVLHGEWIDGFDISGGDPARTEDLLKVLMHLKRNGIKIQINSDGRNAAVLKAVLENQLGDRLILEIKGPAIYYRDLCCAIEEDELKQSILLASRFPEYQLYTTVAPWPGPDGSIRYLTPDQIADTAKMIESATGSKRHPYELRLFDPQQSKDQRLKKIEPLAAEALFKYRTAARRYVVSTEIAK